MTLFNKRFRVAGLTAAFAVVALVLVQGQARPMCDPDNGGLKLPAGFCALVVADGLGTARHMTVAPNGDLDVALMTSGGRGQPQTGGGAVALRDANGDGRFEVREPFGSGSTTGIALRNGYVYLAHPTTIERLRMTPGQLKPTGSAETSFYTGGGSKDERPISTGGQHWEWDDTNDVIPDKDDLSNAFAAAYRDPDDGHVHFYFGADRFDTSGDAEVGFWFFRQPVTLDDKPNFNGEHEIGDILVLANWGGSNKVGDIEFRLTALEGGRSAELQAQSKS